LLGYAVTFSAFEKMWEPSAGEKGRREQRRVGERKKPA